jgi:hypothetical protein
MGRSDYVDLSTADAGGEKKSLLDKLKSNKSDFLKGTEYEDLRG